MKISALTSTQVWAASARSLTNIGSGAIAATQTATTALAVSSRVDLRALAGQISQLTIAVETGAGATAIATVQIWDGTTAFTEATTAAAGLSFAGFTGYSNNSVGQSVQNTDATHAAQYIVTGYIWTP